MSGQRRESEKGKIMSDKFDALRRKFKLGDWVFGLGEHKGCSQVFEGHGVLQPFDYLADYDPVNFRLATKDEAESSKGEVNTKEYLGDGVYANWDGYHIVLTAEDGVSVSNTIYLESKVIEALEKYISGLRTAVIDEWITGRKIDE